MGSFLRWMVGFIGIGALLGVGVVSVAAPKFIEWNNTVAYGATKGPGAGLCECAATARQAADALLHWQWIGALVGGGLGGVAGIASAAMLRSKKKREEAALASSSESSTTSSTAPKS
jgi:hypothetical protein